MALAGAEGVQHFEYFRDANELGIPKAMIGMTHELWEDWGMLQPCAQWLARFIPEVSIAPVRTAEFYWTETSTGANTG